MNRKKRNGALDFWKFIFSIVIVFFHTFLVTGYKIHGVQPFINGNSSVEFFFLVSGLLMAQSASKINVTSAENDLGKETLNFITRKLKGLYPEFAIAWFLAFIIMHAANKSLAITSMIKDFLTGIWELCLLRMSGLAEYRANTVTWYISAMILAMLILYPLLIKFKDSFFFIIAPCISIFLLGYMYQAFGDLCSGTSWEGFYYRGFIRALADMSLGCILWKVCQSINKYQYTTLARSIYSAIELGGYSLCLLMMFGKHSNNISFVLLMIFATCVPITFSHVSITATFFDNKICYFLGKVSFSLYIGHIFWVKSLKKFFPSYTPKEHLLILVICLIITVLFIMKLSDLIKKATPSIISFVKKEMIQS